MLDSERKRALAGTALLSKAHLQALVAELPLSTETALTSQALVIPRCDVRSIEQGPQTQRLLLSSFSYPQAGCGNSAAEPEDGGGMKEKHLLVLEVSFAPVLR